MAIFYRRPKSNFQRSKPWLKLGIRRAINSGKYSGAHLDALYAALEDDDVLEAAFNENEAGMPEPPAGGRDWAGFFAALGSFIEKILPLIMQIIQLFGGLAVTAAPEETK